MDTRDALLLDCSSAALQWERNDMIDLIVEEEMLKSGGEQT